jgi:hypothetical protein
MTTQAQSLYDRKGWTPGPWRDEPDRISWVDEATGLDCLMKRHERTLHWCGYVGVPSGHPWNGKSWDDVSADVHGGITYAEACDGDPTSGVCHVAKSGDDDVWWLGFDWAHWGDLMPQAGYEQPSATYRTAEWVKKEVEDLARQAHEAR